MGEHSGQPATLREVTINIWTNERCRAKYGHLAPGGITEHMVWKSFSLIFRNEIDEGRIDSYRCVLGHPLGTLVGGTQVGP